jgi:hypothetical protein
MTIGDTSEMKVFEYMKMIAIKSMIPETAFEDVAFVICKCRIMFTIGSFIRPLVFDTKAPVARDHTPLLEMSLVFSKIHTNMKEQRSS